MNLCPKCNKPGGCTCEDTQPTRRHEECDLSPEDEEIFDEVTRKIIEAGGLENMPDGF